MLENEVELKDIPKALCEDCGGALGNGEGFATYAGGKYKCAECYKKDPFLRPRCEVYSRVVGYLRPTEDWNIGKQEEFKNRKAFRA